ncbi:hypothetical protein HHL23_13375 [Chryseobacterium sp. RP-3-3]|uniref:Uncharacterized protein n=1 Tax=Chryseobacterium antibioticum TaxID=2728847 RepID=A0A7Y0ANW0_9FLAO|nr:hypothetical protein [Chryseobacterium antibioticum]NML70778.1 hypothetical protein [Chryseobacterium antibioticum]
MIIEKIAKCPDESCGWLQLRILPEKFYLYNSDIIFLVDIEPANLTIEETLYYNEMAKTYKELERKIGW